MFGTLRYQSEKKTGEFLERESGFAGNVATNKPQHSACDNCRVKKIRCSGRKAGCSQCKTHSLPCNYAHVPTRKGRRKQAPTSSEKNNETETCPEIGVVGAQSLARDSAATAAVQPSLLTMELHGVSENCIGLDNAMHPVQDNLELALDPMFKEASTWSSHLNWALEGEDNFVPDSDYPIAGNPQVPADFFNSGYSMSESTVQQQPLPLVSNSFTHPDLLPTPPLTHILAPTVSTIRSNEDIVGITIDEQSSCSCVTSAVFLLDELQSSHHEGGPGGQSLDSILLIYREVLFLCNRMINCGSCQGKSENMMVLSMVIERLAILCGEVINAFIAQREASSPEATPIPVLMMEKQPLALGKYEIESGDYEVIMGVLVTRRLSELESIIARMKMIGSLTRRAHQQARMARVDQYIKDLFRKITSICPFVTELLVDPNRPVAEDAGRNI
ncbi:hypothetical protein PENVUL_c030G03366 [Penicillium vulpinum]|uniref:Zn(2)-C6 fungal-type domain-containing protein n=1 Tax=Penicillium vulpinum TaxID=29845 RepID=A0A1V6RTI0_9EURO|nr:hypothetical protein PENVUL_c030G03366 [Penicillium vulpinum]